MKLTYKKRLFLYFLLLFAVFTVCIIFFQQKEEREYKTVALETKLDGYADLIYAYIANNKLDNNNIAQLSALAELLPEEIRITIIQPDGIVVFDKEIANTERLDNHFNRPEILMAQYQTNGINIRKSASTQHEYIYRVHHLVSYL